MKYDNVRIGLNSRLDTIQAAILSVKLKAFAEYELADINEVADKYTARFASLSDRIKTPVVPEGYYSSWAQYTIILESREQRDRVQHALKEQGIPTMIYYPKPMHLQGAFEQLGGREGDFPVSERLCGQVLSLPLHPYQLGLSLRPKRGERVSGDSASQFETENGTLCLLLSDGMGCGEAAQRESAMAVRLLERFLRAGIDAPPALKTLNSALSLRAESTDSFTTVDLLMLSLRTLEGELYKYGAAPSYLKRGGSVRRVTCSCLPAGLQEGSPPPEATHIRLSPGSFLVMLSDGVADSLDDEWLQDLLAGWEGREPRQLAAAILADSLERRGGTDDAGVLVLYIPEELSGAQEI